MRLRFALFFFLILALVGGAVAQGRPALRLKIGDQLKVVVIGFSEFTAEYTVLSDGTITGVGFDRIRAEGQTVEALQKTIRQRLTRFVREPQVALVVSNERRNQVYVVRVDPSGVQLPAAPSNLSGAFPHVPGMELRQLLAVGQVPSRPELYDLQVYRGGRLLKQVDLQRLLAGDPRTWNGPLLPDDMITLTPIQLTTVWVVGVVNRPGEYGIRPNEGLADAIARGLGPTSAAPTEPGRLEVVVRRGPNQFVFPERQLPTAAEFPLQPGDTVTLQLRQLLRISVAGEVLRPGVFEIEPGTSLSEVVGSNAGGPAGQGTLKGVYILRGNEVLVQDATPPAPGTVPFKVETGDSIFVLRNTREIHVLGAVRNPGIKPYPDDKKLFLADALGLAGGLDSDGSLRRVYVLTRDGDKLVTRQYNLDEFLKDGKKEANPELKPGDVVLFGEPKGFTLQNATQILTNILLLDNLLRR